MKAIIRENPVNNCAEIWIIDTGYRDTISLAQPIKLLFKPVKEGDVFSKPTLKIPRSNEFFQSMMKELENLGIQSEDELTIKGKLSATQYHLEDLRKLLKLNKLNKLK